MSYVVCTSWVTFVITLGDKFSLCCLNIEIDFRSGKLAIKLILKKNELLELIQVSIYLLSLKNICFAAIIANDSLEASHHPLFYVTNLQNRILFNILPEKRVSLVWVTYAITGCGLLSLSQACLAWMANLNFNWLLF